MSKKIAKKPTIGPYLYAERKPRKSECSLEGEVGVWVGDEYVSIPKVMLVPASIWIPIVMKAPSKALLKRSKRLVEALDG